MTPYCFTSSLASRMSDFCEFKRAQNYDYRSQSDILLCFDKFLVQQKYGQGILTLPIVTQYVEFLSDYSPISRYNRLCMISAFSRYLQVFEPTSYVLSEIPIKKPMCSRYYIFSDEDIQALLHACSLLTPQDSLKPHTYKTLFGLLYCTGLRINEALSLTLGDVSLERSRLFVRKGKFGKDRWVFLSTSTVHALRQYSILRHQRFPDKQDAPFFINRYGKKVNYKTVGKTFRALRNTCKLGNSHPDTIVRIHDLRHTYATKCLLKWYQSGDDVNVKLPLLATAMGHVRISSTQIYLHITDQIRAHAHQRFFNKFQQTLCNEGGRPC